MPSIETSHQIPRKIRVMPRSSPKKNLSEGYAAVFATILIWSTPSLFQFYLNRYYDPFAQNFYRYSVAFLAVLPFALYRFRAADRASSWNVLGICLLPALPNVVHQITQVVSLHYMGRAFTRSSFVPPSS